LRTYRETHPQGAALDLTLAEETLELTKNRRRADRVIWAGLGRLPGLNEPPTIIIEYVSSGRIDRERDYVAKRAEYREIGVKEYWIIDRFVKRMTVWIFAEEGDRMFVIPADQTYVTGLLPGYELPLGKLIDLANRWARRRK
jgi:Uma2 family endonuclease